MNAKEAYASILEGLAAEVRKRRGQIGRIETELGRDQGYLSKVCSGKRPITVEHLLEVLEVLQVDPGDFLGRALRVLPDVDKLLASVGGRVKDAGLAKIEKVTRQLEAEARALYEMERETA